MKLGKKTRATLELLSCASLDLLDVALHTRALFAAGGWKYESELSRHLKSLKSKGLLAQEETARLPFLKDDAQDELFDNILPSKAWDYPWDGKWRIINFDLPSTSHTQRVRLHNWLRKRRFGNLQGSVWITHRNYGDWEEEIQSRNIDPRTVLFQECKAIGLVSDHDYVRLAWSFDKIESAYQNYLDFLTQNPAPADLHETTPENNFSTWLAQEGELWRSAFQLDPFLPESLLPNPDYLGKKAWAAKRAALSAWVRLYQ